jgi:hypothetical protein
MEGKTMDLTGKRVAILAENMYQELELWYPLLITSRVPSDLPVFCRTIIEALGD